MVGSRAKMGTLTRFRRISINSHAAQRVVIFCEQRLPGESVTPDKNFSPHTKFINLLARDEHFWVLFSAAIFQQPKY
jgi:hypothetical protein